MKKLVCVMVLTAFVCGVKAQKFNFGVRAGLNVAQIGGDKGWDDYKSKIGFHVGVAADYELMESLALESGLYLSMKGAKYDEEGYKSNYILTYLQLPILAAYKYDLGNELKLHGKIGPYLAVGIGARNKIEEGDDKETFKGFGDKDDETGLKAFDAGLQFGIGISKGHYYLGLNYELGLANISAYDEEKAKNRNFTVSLGYNF